MKILSFIDKKLEEWLLSSALLVIILLVIAQSVSRYVISFPIGWSEELVRYIFIWIAWISASYAVRENSHIRVEVLKDKFSPKIKKVIELIVLIIWFLFAVFLLILGTDYVIMVSKTNQISPSLELSMWIVYLAIPIAGLLMGIRLIQQIILVVHQSRT